MRKDHGGSVHFDGFAYNFSRMHLNVAKSTRKKGDYVSTPDSDYLKKITIKISRSSSVSWLCKNSRVVEGLTSAASSTSCEVK